MKRIFLIALLFVSFGLISSAQSDKKKKKYDDYWKSEAIKEQYMVQVKKGDEYFVKKDFQMAVQTYQQAIEIQPSEQHAKAKIRDIEILLANQYMIPVANKENNMDTLDNVSITSYVELAKDETDAEPIAATIANENPSPPVFATPKPVVNKNEKKPAVPAVNPKPAVLTTSPVTKMEQKFPKDKQSKEFSDYLAKYYQEGITEEVITEKTRVTVRRIVVIDGKGIEYLRVAHQWGGLYFFKNGIPTTDRTWDSETVKKE